MANMSYCRFENTLSALRDCWYNMDSNDLSESEFYKRKAMVEMCMSIAEEYDYLLEDEYNPDSDIDEEDDED